MKTINVATAFTLIVKAGVLVSIPAGLQLVEDEIADHWFTKAHLAEAGVGTEQNAEVLWAVAADAWDKAQAAGEAYEAALLAAKKADEEAGLEPRHPPHVEYMTERMRATEADDDVEQEGEEPAGQPEQPPVDNDHVAEGASLFPETAPEAPAAAAEDTGGTDTAEAAAAAPEPAPEPAPVEQADTGAGGANPLDHDGVDGAGGSVAVTSPKPFDEMTDDELRGFITERDGKAPHPNAGRPTLLARARKEAAEGA